MRVFGLDFTSAPGRRKPLIALRCELTAGVLRVEDEETLTDFGQLEAWLETPGPWVCGMDFPFGQPESLVAALGWPKDWEGYVGEISRLGKEGFESAIRADMASRPSGKKWRYRLADRRSGSSSAMMLFRVPVGKMFFQGAPRLLRSGISVVPCRPNGDSRVAVEAYPAVVARRFLRRDSYKRDGVPDTPERKAAREKLVSGLGSEILRRAYGFTVTMDDVWRRRFIEEPGADALDSLLCAIQAAWAYTKKDEGWGVPPECDRNEGWILDPALLEDWRTMTYGQRFEEALTYAARVHAGQYRKGTGVPYVTHLLAVAAIVGENGGTEDEVIAALLHDAPEDAGGEARLEDIRLRFGAGVAEIVAGCTDTYEDPKPPWRQRKEEYLAHLAKAPAPVRLVSAADKLHNARSVLADYRTIGEDLWGRFNGGRDGTLWYYRAVADGLAEAGDGPVVDELDRVVTEMVRVAGGPG